MTSNSVSKALSFPHAVELRHARSALGHEGAVVARLTPVWRIILGGVIWVFPACQMGWITPQAPLASRVQRGVGQWQGPKNRPLDLESV